MAKDATTDAEALRPAPSSVAAAIGPLLVRQHRCDTAVAECTEGGRWPPPCADRREPGSARFFHGPSTQRMTDNKKPGQAGLFSVGLASPQAGKLNPITWRQRPKQRQQPSWRPCDGPSWQPSWREPKQRQQEPKQRFQRRKRPQRTSRQSGRRSVFSWFTPNEERGTLVCVTTRSWPGCEVSTWHAEGPLTPSAHFLLIRNGLHAAISSPPTFLLAPRAPRHAGCLWKARASRRQKTPPGRPRRSR